MRENNVFLFFISDSYSEDIDERDKETCCKAKFKVDIALSAKFCQD